MLKVQKISNIKKSMGHGFKIIVTGKILSGISSYSNRLWLKNNISKQLRGS